VRPFVRVACRLLFVAASFRLFRFAGFTPLVEHLQRSGVLFPYLSNAQSDDFSILAFLVGYRPGLHSGHLGLQFIEDLAHDWTTTHAAWNQGKYDQWVPNKGTTTMAHLVRSDIPFHYALADAFTICDAYHYSLFGRQIRTATTCGPAGSVMPGRVAVRWLTTQRPGTVGRVKDLGCPVGGRTSFTEGLKGHKWMGPVVGQILFDRGPQISPQPRAANSQVAIGPL
jgi:Phosphoesterase family